MPLQTMLDQELIFPKSHAFERNDKKIGNGLQLEPVSGPLFLEPLNFIVNAMN